MTKACVFALALLAAFPAGRALAAGPAAGVVYFTQWSALLDDSALTLIKQAASTVGASTAGVTVTGYADTTGSTEANDLMSKLRAQVVIDQLVADGVPAARLKRADRGATPDVGGLNESRRVLISLDN